MRHLELRYRAGRSQTTNRQLGVLQSGARQLLMLAIMAAVTFSCTDSGNSFDYTVRQVGNVMVFENTSGTNLTDVRFYANGSSTPRQLFGAGAIESIQLSTFGIQDGTKVQTTMIYCDQGYAVRNR